MIFLSHLYFYDAEGPQQVIFLTHQIIQRKIMAPDT